MINACAKGSLVTHCQTCPPEHLWRREEGDSINPQRHCERSVAVFVNRRENTMPTPTSFLSEVQRSEESPETLRYTCLRQASSE